MTAVSTIIQNLEAFLGVRLLQRTTRRLNLTPDGAAYYEHCVRILADVEEIEASFLDGSKRPRGKQRRHRGPEPASSARDRDDLVLEPAHAGAISASSFPLSDV